MAQSDVEDDFTESVDNYAMGVDESIGKTSLQRRTVNPESSDDGDEVIPLLKAKTRVQRLADSCSDSGKTITQHGDESPLSDEEVILPRKSTFQNNSDNSSDISTLNNHPQKSRIRNVSNDEDSDPHSLLSGKKVKVALKNKEQQTRMSNKKDKMRNKFKKLIYSRETDNNLNKDLGRDDNTKCDYEWMDNESEYSEEDSSSIEKLKQVGQVYKPMEDSLKFEVEGHLWIQFYYLLYCCAYEINFNLLLKLSKLCMGLFRFSYVTGITN